LTNRTEPALHKPSALLPPAAHFFVACQRSGAAHLFFLADAQKPINKKNK
jgi:hypothetical protein